MPSHRDRLRQWFLIEGQSPADRIRRNIPQLAVLGVLTWISAALLYRFVATVIDPITAVLVLLVGGLYAGLKLQTLLVRSDTQS